MDEKYKRWKGIDRNKIKWAPSVDTEKCKGCGMCVTTCGREVFDFDIHSKKAVVSRPLQCMVGCTSCSVWCVYDAISFPAPEIVRNFIKENHVLAIVKRQLREKYPEIDG